MELEIRDKKDPFSQALAFLFKSEANAPGLKQKLREEMVPLVTQVAIKIGGIDSEKSVRDRALAVFTGTISIHLAHTSVGKQGDLISGWASMVKDADLQLLFRGGYTLIKDLLIIHNNQVSFGDWLAQVKRRAISSQIITELEYLERLATGRDEAGFWIGYAGLKDQFETRERFEYNRWLIEQIPGAEQDIIEHRDAYNDPETVLRRVLLNVFLSNRLSLAMDFRKVQRVIDGLYKKKGWLAKAKKRYEQFLPKVPEQFRSSLLNENGNLQRYQILFWDTLERYSAAEVNPEEALDYLCMSVGIFPPGMSKIDRSEIKRYEIEE